jgi:hypothetical protein
MKMAILSMNGHPSMLNLAVLVFEKLTHSSKTGVANVFYPSLSAQEILS